MKTSNKILLSFFIFLFGGIVLLFIGAKYFKDAYGNEDNFLTQEKPLNTFSVVVAETGANFVLKSGTKNKIIQNYLKDAVPNFAPYVVRNDTLFVYSVKKEQSNKQGQSEGGYFIIVPEIFCQNVKSIVAKENSEVRLNEFQTDSLSINLNKAKLNWTFDKVVFVSIQAKDSDIYLDGKNLKRLTVKLDKTKLRAAIKERGDKLSGSLKSAI